MRQPRGCGTDDAGDVRHRYAEIDPKLTRALIGTRSALPGLEATLRLVDDVDAALAAHDAIVAVTAAQRFQ
jgi:hypothetical protein